MTAQGWISFELAAAMVLGENIGTTITANLAATVANYQAKRTARAHLIFNVIGVIWVLILFYPFLNVIDKLVVKMGSDSPFENADAIPIALSLFHTVFNLINTFILVWFVKPIANLVEKMVVAKTEIKEIDEPKYLNQKVLKYPETLISSLVKESKNLYNGALFEIVAHGLSIHRAGIKSDLKIKDIVKQSKKDMQINVDELYYSKIKTIYGEIIKYATIGQSNLNLTEAQNKHISEIKIANRKMVEIVRDVKELSRNVSMYLNSDNKYLQKEYYRFRKKIVKVLRIIYLFRKQENNEQLYEKLLQYKEDAKKNLHHSNKSINELIRNNLVSANMASSLINDNDHVNNLIDKLITVAELLYGEKDSLLDYGSG